MSKIVRTLTVAVARAALNGQPLPVAGDWKIIKGEILHDNEIVARFEKRAAGWGIQLVEDSSTDYWSWDK